MDPNRPSEDFSDNFKVVIRIRPPSIKELENKRYLPTTKCSEDKKSLVLFEYFPTETQVTTPYFSHNFTFDHIFDENSTQNSVYDLSIQQSIHSVLDGYHATILAYGQTGAGKTYTMEGNTLSSETKGIIPRSIIEMFSLLEQNRIHYKIRVSYFQIYNENIYDLLTSEKQSLQIREDKKKGVFVEGLSEYDVSSCEEIFDILQKGSQMRVTGSTKVNDLSSRSHAIFVMNIRQFDELNKIEETKFSRLNFVDLAGSERVRSTGATGIRLEESKKINQSLSALGNVISALAEAKPKSHIPFRDSKIARILENSLGGNCKTVLMVMISPSCDAFGETLCSLKFATRAKRISNHAVINAVPLEKASLEKLESQINNLQIEVMEKNKIIKKYEEKEIKEIRENLKEKMFERLPSKLRNESLDRKKDSSSDLGYEKQDFINKQKDLIAQLEEKLQEKENTIRCLQEDNKNFDNVHKQLKEALNKEKFKNATLEKTLKENRIFYVKNENKCEENFKTQIAENNGDMTTRLKEPSYEERENKENRIKEKNDIFFDSKSFSKMKSLKCLIDEIIENLSKPNDPDQLKNVANDLIAAQNKANKLLRKFSDINSMKQLNSKKKSPFLNLTNLVQYKKNDKENFNKSIIYSSNAKEPNMENLFNFIPIRGDIDINDIITK